LGSTLVSLRKKVVTKLEVTCAGVTTSVMLAEALTANEFRLHIMYAPGVAGGGQLNWFDVTLVNAPCGAVVGAAIFSVIPCAVAGPALVRVIWYVNGLLRTAGFGEGTAVKTKCA
jgi:hypothetical protein